MSRPKAYFINGGAGRVISSIPAFEKLAEKEEDFIIVCEGGMDFYKGHPVLHNKAYDNWHKGLFEEHLKHRDIVSPEPYRVWEYFNQKCSLAQAFDILINNEGVRELQDPSVYLNKMEIAEGYNVIQEVKSKTGFDKVLVVQPFGRGIQNLGEMVIDPTSRSMHLNNVIEIINELKKEYAVILMSEFPVALEENDSNRYPVAMPQIPDLRVWASIIEIADHFLGVDSVGQHIAKAMGKTATVICGSTYPINISYPESKDFDIFDVGEGKRIYDPIRLTMEDEVNRHNDEVMDLSREDIQSILKSVRTRLGKSTKFKGTYNPPQVQHTTCATPSTAPLQMPTQLTSFQNTQQTTQPALILNRTGE
jgi:hypothetical protein